MSRRVAIQGVCLVGAAILTWPALRGGGAVDLAVATAGLVFAGIAVVSLPSHRMYAALSATAAAAWLLADSWSQMMWIHRPLMAAIVLSFPQGRLQGRVARAVVALLAASTLFPSAARSPQLTLLLAGGLAACAWWEVKAARPAYLGAARARAAAASTLALAMVIPAVVHWIGPLPISLTQPPTPLIVAFLVSHVVPGLELAYAVLVAVSGGILLVRLLSGVEESEADFMVALSERSPSEILDVLRGIARGPTDSTEQHALVAAAGLLERNLALQADLADAVEDVRLSRRALVNATEFERRSLRRRLAASALPALPEVESQLIAIEEVAEGLVLQCRREVVGIRDDLDRLADGLHPTGLARDGLAGLRDVGARCPVPVVVDVPGQRLPREVEEAVWFAITEALTNAVKHAQASTVQVCLAVQDGFLVGDVIDDGAGGARFDAGGGLLGLRDRLEAVGGRVALDSPAGIGTTVAIEVPLP